LARDLLARGLAELGEEPEPAALQRLVHLAERVAAWTRRVDLTSHETPEAVAGRLILDSAALLRVAPEFESLADLGSGAGFPGLPIAILRPACRVTLVESRERRHHFQRAVIRELGLANARALRGRAERLETEPHAAAVAQATTSPPDALLLLLRWVEPGGLLLLPGGEVSPQLPETPQVASFKTVSYQVPASGRRRSLWIGRRAAD
jgi:16S rRNA (guanine527-N7)-methyltransferase